MLLFNGLEGENYDYTRIFKKEFMHFSLKKQSDGH